MNDDDSFFIFYLRLIIGNHRKEFSLNFLLFRGVKDEIYSWLNVQ